jgi:DNA ligase (NAD+)
MTPDERHRELLRQIAEHDHRYYVLDAPAISDRDYDALFSELKALEEKHPELVHADSPTQRVGEQAREGVTKVAHQYPMFSLDNTYSEDELREFDRRVRDVLAEHEPQDAPSYVAEPKLDGASLEVVYEGGRLVLGATRGDGRIGEDVTANVRTIRALPLVIADKRKLTLRGEVVIFKRDLAAINELRIAKDEEPFANPRNAAAGALRVLDTRLSRERRLRVFFYDLVERYYPSHHEALDALAALGLPTHGLQRVCANVDEVLAFIGELDQKRRTLPYETDGLVVKVDRFEQRELLGFTSRFPRWAIAYKFEAERAFTVVRAIETDLGRTGALTPVAILDPVPLSGTVVARASLHNVDYVKDKDVRIGDTVSIEKAGEIIPQVIGVSLERRPDGTVPWSPPTHCPVCNSAVSRGEDEAALRCPNARCPGRVKAGIFYFTRRGAMDVDRLGWSLVEQLVETGMLRDVGDIFALPERRAELLELPRMADKSVDNVLAAVVEARTGRTFGRLLTGLGIPLVGNVAANAIADRYPDLPSLLAVEPPALSEALGEIHGIGPKIADSMARYLADAENRALLQKLLDLGVRSTVPDAPISDGPLSGSSFCVSGTLSEPREQIHALIRAAGGVVHERVGKGTTYLVAGDKVGATKISAAEKRGTKMIREPELRAMLAGNPPQT